MTHNQVIQIVSNWFKLKKEVKLVSRFSFDFPVPDIQIQTINGEIIQVECKPSTENKREYITGLGQSIAYCIQADYSYLALPIPEMQKFEKWLWPEFIGLLGVDINNVVEIRKPIKSKIKTNENKQDIKRGYAYYRDLTIDEIYHITKALSSHKITLNQEKVDNIIWNEITKYRKWKSSKFSNLTNIKLLLRDLKLFNFKENELLKNGIELIQIGDKNNKEMLLEFGRKLFLIDGNFIDIVAIIQELNEDEYSYNNIHTFKKALTDKIITEKLATETTNVNRDLQDILRILHNLDVLKHNKKRTLFNTPYSINWKSLIPFIKNR